ncbi:hypothetical protein za3_6 [Zamilon virus]|uniref:Uncharacterized protein n=1 Tax=Zamilon virus TaxID=1411887 RepID=A0A2P1EHI3_9VIRU|nr:hypothetical protein za3_6 [Zamilon virus]
MSKKVLLSGTAPRGGCFCPNCGTEVGGVLAGVLSGGRMVKRRVKKGGIGTKTGAKKSPWVAFLQKFAKEHGMKYGEAMQSPKAKKQYEALKKKSGKTTKKKSSGSKTKKITKKKPVKKSLKGGSKRAKRSPKMSNNDQRILEELMNM